jgi:hypothetical protein
VGRRELLRRRRGRSFHRDGWFKTGDVVTLDAEGYVRITDRSKDVIKSGGEWISSVALENALMSHPAVLEAAVFAARAPALGRAPARRGGLANRGRARRRTSYWPTSRGASRSSGCRTPTCCRGADPAHVDGEVPEASGAVWQTPVAGEGGVAARRRAARGVGVRPAFASFLAFASCASPPPRARQHPSSSGGPDARETMALWRPCASANSPPCRTSGQRGGATSSERRASSSVGVSTRCVRPWLGYVSRRPFLRSHRVTRPSSFGDSSDSSASVGPRTPRRMGPAPGRALRPEVLRTDTSNSPGGRGRAAEPRREGRRARRGGRTRPPARPSGLHTRRPSPPSAGRAVHRRAAASRGTRREAP